MHSTNVYKKMMCYFQKMYNFWM